jgi:hypothetical protein
MLTTPPAILDVTKDFPALFSLARTTVRLHPRRAPDGAIDGSKLGGEFLWPLDEPWPSHVEARVDRFYQELLSRNERSEGRISKGTSIPFAPILQLRSADFPEMPFPAGADLFQLLWFPYGLEVPSGQTHPDSSIDYRVYWRDASAISPRRSQNPEMVVRRTGDFAQPSRLDPERVVEYPNSQDLDPAIERRIDRWKAVKRIDHDGDSPIDFYDWECSACPSTKVGGHVFWVQEKKVPICWCGRPMTHLLSVSDSEWDGGTFRRWEPVEERGKNGDGGSDGIGSPPRFGGFGHFYLFVCRECEGFPTRAVTAR